MHQLEKRQLERFELSLPAKIQIISDEHSAEMASSTTNVSSGGAYFEMQQPLAVGTEVKIDLTLPLDKFVKLVDTEKSISVSLTGKVTFNRTDGMGVSFNENYKIFR